MKIFLSYIPRILFTCVIYFLLYPKIWAQSPVTYTYDNNGNRLTRSIVLKKSFATSDSISQDEFDKEIFKDEIGDIQIRIFPNPTKGNLQIEILGVSNENLIEYSLYNSSGILLKKQEFTDLLFRIDFSNHPSGIYILRLKLKGEVSEWKIIKE